MLYVPGFFSGDHLELANFLKASIALRDSYRFAHTTDLGIGRKHGVDREYVEYRFKRERKYRPKERKLIFVVILMLLWFVSLYLSRCVLLFRPPHLSNVFEDSVLKFADSVSTATLRTFLRDNMSVPLSDLVPVHIYCILLFPPSYPKYRSLRDCLINQNTTVIFFI